MLHRLGGEQLGVTYRVEVRRGNGQRRQRHRQRQRRRVADPAPKLRPRARDLGLQHRLAFVHPRQRLARAAQRLLHVGGRAVAALRGLELLLLKAARFPSRRSDWLR